MNTYFSSTSAITCGSGCDYRTCPERYLHKLRELPKLRELGQTSCETLFQPTMAAPLRSGDLLIFQVDNREDLERLITHRGSLEQFRLVLILGDEAFRDSRCYHQLNPRFIMTNGQDPASLTEVVARITEQSSAATEKRRQRNQPAAHY